LEGENGLMENILQAILGEVGHLSPWIAYLYFFASAVLQSTFPPYPGDTVLVFGGYLGSAGFFGGEIPIFISYWLGTIVSSFALYELGVWKGESVLKIGIISKYFPGANQKKAKGWLFKYGIIMLFICKFIPGLNSLVIILGGIFRYKKPWAYAGVGLASIVHNLVFLLTGRAIGSNIDSISGFLSTYNKAVLAIVIVSAAIYLLYRKFQRRII
jgi:membrane protein DedA with SNARE-associated domain